MKQFFNNSDRMWSVAMIVVFLGILIVGLLRLVFGGGVR